MALRRFEGDDLEVGGNCGALAMRLREPRGGVAMWVR